MEKEELKNSRREALRKMALLGTGAILFPSVNLFAGTSSLSAASFKTRPYLQNPSPTAMTICWIASTNSFSWVEYGETTELGQKTIGKKHGMAVANNTVNKIRLTGLKPATKYYYRVCSKEIIKLEAYQKEFGMTLNSIKFEFTTPGESPEKVRALVFNDLHERPASIKALLNYNTGIYDFVFLNGDLISEFEDQTRAIKSVIDPCCDNFATRIPFYFGRGNHETRGAHAFNFSDYFDSPSENLYYSFTWGPVYFIVLDSGEDKEDSNFEAYGGLAFFDEYRIEQKIWLEKELNSPERKAAKYTVVLMHIPTHHAGDWHGTTHCRQFIGNTLNKYDISVLIAGHTHSAYYCPGCTEHNYPIMIGGGPADDKRTLIRLEADSQELNVSMLSDNGTTLSKLQVNAKK